MAGGTLGFIAEIAYGGKLILPAISFPIYEESVNGGIHLICFGVRQALDVTVVLWYIGTTN
jgi:hypothetical protein